MVFKIISTVFIAISCLTTLLKNCVMFKDIQDDRKLTRSVAFWTIYGWLWRAFVIVSLWLI